MKQKKKKTTKKCTEETVKIVYAPDKVKKIRQSIVVGVE